MKDLNLLREVKKISWPWLDLIMVTKLSLALFIVLIFFSGFNLARKTMNRIHYENLVQENRHLELKLREYKKNYKAVIKDDFEKSKTNFMLEFLNFCSEKIPEGLWLTSFELSTLQANNLILQGKAYYPEQIAEFLQSYDEAGLFNKQELKAIEETRGEDNLIYFVLSTDDKWLQNKDK